MIMDYFADAVSWGAYVCAEQNGLMAVNGDDVINEYNKNNIITKKVEIQYLMLQYSIFVRPF